jgi:hypothetical protein
MASLASVNKDGVSLNTVGAVQDDTDARNLAAHLSGRSRSPQPRRLSREDEAVHEAYDILYDIVKKPQNYTADKISDIIVEITEEDDSPVVRYGRFAGNYNADLADRDSNVYKYWRNYRSHKKRWDAKRDEMVARKKEELEEKGMKITDGMDRKEKRKIVEKRRPLLREVFNKYNRGGLGQQIYYLLGKVEEIEHEKRYGASSSDSSDSSEDKKVSAGASKEGGRRKTRKKRRRKKTRKKRKSRKKKKTKRRRRKRKTKKRR